MNSDKAQRKEAELTT